MTSKTFRAVALATAVVLSALPMGGSSSAAPITLTADLTGLEEVPPNASPGTGFASVILDVVAHTLHVDTAFSGLLSPTTAAHIHCCFPTATPGILAVATQAPTFIGFPLDVTSGTFSDTYDLTDASSYRAGFITDTGGIAQAEAALVSALLSGEAYFNIHSTQFPLGEIRGQLEVVPLPGALVLFGSALLAAGLMRRRFSLARK